MDSRWEPAHKMLEEQQLDLRVNPYRYMDQKVTPDVLQFIASSILNLSEIQQSAFTKDHIWRSTYFRKNVPVVFGKPKPDEKSAANEYDKFVSQPLKTLAYSGVLSEEKRNHNWYGVLNVNVLEIVAQDALLAMEFLHLYNSVVLERSGMIKAFHDFRLGDHSEESYMALRDRYIQFMRGATNIGARGSDGAVEIRRIFPKVLNPMAAVWGTPGSIRGHVSKWPITMPDLAYNRENFRDKNVGKHKSQTREQSIASAAQVVRYKQYEIRGAMNLVRKRHFPTSEVNDSFSAGEANEVHHIFPQSKFPELSSVSENLILLTSTQHHGRAHANGKHHMVDREYQRICLLAKLGSIEGSIAAEDGFYSKERFVEILNQGLNLSVKPFDSFDTLRMAIKKYSYL